MVPVPSVGVLLAVVAVAVVVAGLVVWVRHRFVMRALGLRVGWDVLPAPELDPGEAEVAFFGGQLVRARSAVHAVLFRPAAACRVHLQSVGDGMVSYRLWTPRAGLGVVPGAMYKQTVLRRIEDQSGMPVGLVPDVELLERADPEDWTIQ